MGRKRPTTTTPGLLHSGGGGVPFLHLQKLLSRRLLPASPRRGHSSVDPVLGGRHRQASMGQGIFFPGPGDISLAERLRLMDTRKTFNDEVVPWLQRTARICPLARKPGGDFDNAHPNRGHYRYSWPYHKTPPPENYIDSPKCGYRFIFTSAKTGWLMWREDDGGAWGERWGG